MGMLGGAFWGKSCPATERIAVGSAPRHSARHCTNRAIGLVMSACCGSANGSDQALQVSSGRAEFPDRVRNLKPGPPSRHCRCPHLATLPESWTCDSYQPEDARPEPKLKARAGLLRPA